MKTLVVLCNIVLFVFTCLVLVTDGPSDEMAYIIFTLLLLLIPILTVFAIVRRGSGTPGGPEGGVLSKAQARMGLLSADRTPLENTAGICNLVLLGFVCWALVDQYPHPAEEGLVAFVVVTLLTPLLSAVVLLTHRRSSSRPGPWAGF